jgi:phenylacetate-CoA ligase
MKTLPMKMRKMLYFTYTSLVKRSSLFQFYEEFSREDESGVSADTTRKLLVQLLTHCQKSVPYYRQAILKLGDSFKKDPESYLLNFPILTKDTIRNNFEQLKSEDLAKRQWEFNTSGGSTGEPIKLIQDQDYFERAIAISRLYCKWIGREIGEPEVCLWGSERELFQNSMGWKAFFSNQLTNTTYLNAFRMSPQKMREFVDVLNSKRPKLIVAYAQAIYELAKFAEEERLSVVPQKAIITSAGTLYAFMREKIESIFQCRVFNRYGSREVGDVACERPGFEGLWVAPWGSYVEIVDDDDHPVPPGVEGNILVTSLINYAMPLIRYKIGDRGVLAAESQSLKTVQILHKVSGRITDNFKTRTGKIVPGEYFIHLLGVVLNNEDIKKFQIIQKSYDLILLKIVKTDKNSELDTSRIVEKINLVMNENYVINVEFVDDIPPVSSGKYRYTISEVY